VSADVGPDASGPFPEATSSSGMTVVPDAATFRLLAREHRVVPVFAELLGDCETPVSAFMKLRDDHSFLLESVEHGESWGRFSFLGRDPQFTLRFHDGEVTVDGDCPPDVASQVAGMTDPWAAIDAVLAEHSAPTLEGLPPLHCGLVGYWGYEMVRFTEPTVPVTNPDDLGVPDMLLYGTGTVLAFDHFRQRIVVVRNVYLSPEATDDDLDTAWADAVERIEEVRAGLARPLAYDPEAPPPASVDTATVPSNLPAGRFAEMVETARGYIAAGDCFQVVLSQRFSQPLECDPFEVHRALRVVSPSPYMTFLTHPDVTIVCASPEELVRVHGDRALTRPIAGTRWRGRDEAHDQRLAEELRADPKECAEHVMLVDLARNDLGRVGRYGSVTVGDLMVVERYSHVMHLVSTVTAQLRAGVGALDVLRATFPAGTVSGAPKVRAMQIVDELEPTRRGPYAGVVGYVDFSGNLDTALTLRTAVIVGDTVHVQAGAGVVADSVAADEELETRNKARNVLTAVAMANGRARRRAANGDGETGGAG
jgi:anthranilate synthase component 1